MSYRLNARGSILVMLIFSVLLFCFPVRMAGQTAVPPTGDGSVGNPYLIASLDNLYWLSQQTDAAILSSHFRQIADIDASSTATWDSGKGFFPIGSDTNPFKGVYDGGSYTIKNLKIVRASAVETNIGFFSVIASPSQIKNVWLDHVSVEGVVNVGGLIGLCKGGTVTNCMVRGVVTSGSDFVGGLIGMTSTATTTVTNCFVTGSLTANNNVGGLVGATAYATNVEKCYANVSITCNTGGGGLIGSAGYGTTEITKLTECYAAGSIAGNNFLGYLFGEASYVSINNCAASTSMGPAVVSAIGHSNWGNNVTNNLMLLTPTQLKNQADYPPSWAFNPSVSTGGSGTWVIDPDANNGYASFPWEFEAPAVQTTSATSLTTAGVTTGTFKGSVTQLGYPSPEYGFCYVVGAGTPTVTDTKLKVGNVSTLTAPQAYTATPTLARSTTYTVRAYAANSTSTVYGAPLTFTANIPPWMTSIDVPADGTYLTTQNLDFVVHFDNDVTVTGMPQLDIKLNSSGTVVKANYVSGSGTNELIFRYTVVSGNVTTTGITINALSANGGTLKDEDNNNADLTLRGVPVTTGILIDGTPLTPNINTTATTFAYKTPFDITITFNRVISGFDLTDILGTSCSISDLSTTDNKVFTATVTPTTAGNFEAKVVVAAAQDAAGNTSAEAIFLRVAASRTLNITAVANNKTYDGNTTATVSLSSDKVAGDDVTISYTAANFDNKNVGTGKTVTVTGIAIGGADAANYTLASTSASTTASITTKTLTVTATADNKTYDANTTATINLLSDKISGDVLTITNTSANFDNKNVGTGKTVTVAGISISSTDAANYTLASSTITSTANITVRTLTITASANNKTYDGNAVATTTLSSDKLAGDILTISSTNSSFDNKNVGTGKTVSVTGVSISGTDAANYTLASTTVTTTASINTQTLNVTAVATNKTYDGNTTASVTLSSDMVVGDGLTVSYTAANFDTKNIGTGKTVTVTGISIGGADAGNYTLASTTVTTNAAITTRTLSVTATASDKVYDGFTTAVVTLSSNKVTTDVLVIGNTSSDFSNKNVGNGKTVTVSGITISGADAGNYTLAAATITTLANITAKTLTVTASANNKTYDGNTVATVALSADKVATDVFTISNTDANFDTKNVGSGKTVTVTGIAISGTDAGNYILAATTATTTAAISSLTLTITALANNKTYDGNVTATVTLSSDAVATDAITITNTSATFNNKNVGTGKTVTVSGITISGADAGNYTLASTTVNTTASITAKTLTVTASANDKIYDGHTVSTITLSSDKVVADALTISHTIANFDNKNIGSGKTVTVVGISISGADAGNYTLAATTVTTTAAITAKSLTVTASASNKTYDGTTTASVTLTSDKVAADALTISYVSADFDTKNTGSGKTVTVTGLAISGADASNYTLAATTATTTASITTRTLTVTATADNKTYDGYTTATVILSSDKAGSDVLTITNAAANFNNKNVGTGKTVNVTGIAISGVDASNYTLAATIATTTASITTKTLTVSVSANDKTYDGNTSASVTLTSDKVATDVVTISNTSADFNNKNVGTGKTVTVVGIAMSGADAPNYTLASTTATAIAAITARTLTVAAVATNKTYDGTTTASVTLSSDRVGSDAITITNTNANFDTKNVGTGKTVTVTGISISGVDAPNYTLASNNTTTTAAITTKTLTVTASASDKVYDGYTGASVVLSSDKVATDVLTITEGTANFNNKNVGTGKTVTATGITLSGADAVNYTLAATTVTTTASITKKTLTVTASASDKIYDGSTTAAVVLTSDKATADILTISNTDANFDNKNIGTGKTVTIIGLTLGGTDAANYNLAVTTVTTTANITLKTLTISATATNKNYDGTTDAYVTLTSDKATADVITISYTAANFDTKNVGTGKTVTVTGVTIAGADAANYVLASTSASTTASIIPYTLTITASANDKVYDGNTVATVTLSSDKASADVISISYTSAAFNNKNVGTGKTVTVTGITITGVDAPNYTLAATTVTTNASIQSKTLTVTATANNKIYDGNTTASITLTSNKAATDALTISNANATFDTKNVGAGKTVTVTGIAISGIDAANYTLAATTTTATADITIKTLTVTASASNKIYDGITTAAVTLSSDKATSDVLTVSYTNADFDTKNIGAGKTVTVTGITLSGADATNYALGTTTVYTTASITAKTLTVTALANDKVYDGNVSASVTLSSDKASADVITISNTGATFNNKNVGSGKTVTVTGISISGVDAGNYTIAASTLTATAAITTRTLNVTASAPNKIYDGLTDATATFTSDKIAADALAISYATANFDNKNVGTGKTVSVAGITINGVDAANYTLASSTATTTASITLRTLTVTTTASNKTYDGSTQASVTLSSDKIASDIISVTYTAANFNNKNIGAGKPVTVTGIAISGIDATNYTLSGVAATTTASITSRILTVTASANDKVYDGGISATVSLTADNVAGDLVTFTHTDANFNNKNVGTGKPVTISGISIGGVDAANYTLASATTATTASITAKTLTVTALATNKNYDGNTIASVSLSSNKATADVLTLSYTTANFDNKNVGTGKTVTVTGIAIGGTDAANYSLAATNAVTSAAITAKTLTVSATANNKVYDGTATASVSLSSDQASGDVLTITYTTANFDNKNTGAGKTVTVNGIAISGTDAPNYTLANTTATTTAAITSRLLTVSTTADNKTYDGNTTATITLLSDKIATDVLSITNTSATFDNKNVGTAKLVTVTGIAISGTDAANYTLAATTATATASITQRTLNVTATATNKVYDGNTVALATLSSDKVSSDVLTLTYTTANFDNKNTGVGKAVTVTGITVGGADAANYTLASTTATTTASITPRTLTVSATASNKTYDGTTLASASLSSDKVMADVLTITFGTANFDTKNVGAGKTVTVSGIAISGTDAANYTLASTTASTTATITLRALTVTATGNNKIYDGNTTANVSLNSDKVAADILTITNSSANFDNKNVGTGKTITVTGIAISGTDAVNYTLTATTTSATANITLRTLTVTAIADNKVYDGTTTATATLSSNKVATDILTITNATADFDTKNVGAGKTVTVTGIAIAGVDAINYTLDATTVNTTASITARNLTVTATGNNKVYDGNIIAYATLTSDKVTADALNITYATANFDTKNVGTGKTITVNGIAISGTDAANYTLVSTTTTTNAAITLRILNVTATGHNKIYDGNTNATVTLTSDKVAADVLTITYAAANFDTKNTGTGKTVTVTGIAISGTDAANYTLASTTATTTANITLRPLNVVASANDKVYDGNTTATATLTSDKVTADVLTITNTTANFDNKNAGVGKTVTVTGVAISGTDASNYTLTSTTITTTASITLRALIVTATASDKVYDGNTTATITLASDKVAADIITITNAAANFDSKNVGVGKTVTVTGITISGTDAPNYTLASTTVTATATITQRTLNIAATANNKVYDGNTIAVVSFTSDKVATDILTITNAAANFDNKNVGTGKMVTVTGITISGTDATNYTLASTTVAATADITLRTLNVVATANDKVYDGNTTATVNLNSDKVTADVMTITNTIANFDNKNVGTGKTVTVTGIAISGTDAANYTLATTTITTTGNITVRILTVTTIASNKVYDGNTIASVAFTSDQIAGDVLTISNATANFDSKNVGVGKSVTVTGITISGTDAANYTLAATVNTSTANITPRTVTATVVANNKTYDGNTVALIALSSDKVTGDVLTLTYATANFDNKNVGTGKTVTVTGIAIGGGADAANYTLATSTVSTTANITVRILTVAATAADKVYDGNTIASINLTSDKIVSDVLTVTNATADFNNKNTGIGKPVTVTGIAISGPDALNYTLAATLANTTANITARILNVTATANDKVYDGNTTAIVVLTSDKVAADILTVTNIAANFDNKNAGIGKTVTITGMAISGADAGNYTLASTATTTNANIIARVLNFTASAVDKIYDGNTSALVTFTSDKEAADVVNVIYVAANFDNKNAGNGKMVTVTGITLSGSDATNYMLASASFVTTAAILKKKLTISDPTLTLTKIYDATTQASYTALGVLVGVVSGDDISVSATSDYVDKNAGAGKLINVVYNLSGASLPNYIVPDNYQTYNGTILPKQLTITSPTVITKKMYDGTAVAQVTAGTLVGVENSDLGKVNVSVQANYDNANVGVNKPILIQYAISGSESANYIKPVDETVPDGIIAEKIVLTLSSTQNSVCSGNSVLLDYVVLKGNPGYYKLIFDDKALEQGMVNSGYAILTTGATGGQLTMMIPDGMKEGIYTAYLQMTDNIGESDRYPFSFIVSLSSDYVLTKFDDVIFCNNAEDKFTQYQWYKNGQEIEGATAQFYNDRSGVVGIYYVRVVTRSGETLFSCPKAFNVPLQHDYSEYFNKGEKNITVYPNPVGVNKKCYIKTENFTDAELGETNVTLYDINGKALYTGNVLGLNHITMPSASGIYMLRFEYSTYQVFYKILVK